MKFGELPIDEAIGGILAHSLALDGGKRLRKGLTITSQEVKLMRQTGLKSVVVAMPGTEDVLEDDAAAYIADQFTVSGFRIEEARTGRVNLYSNTNGVFRVNKELVDALNHIDPGVAFSTLNDLAEVNEGRLIATVKIIPYALPKSSLEKIKALGLSEAISVVPYQQKRIGLVFTEIGTTKPSVLDKTRKILERRLALSGSYIIQECRVGHDVAEATEAIRELSPICDLIMLFGASAISDRGDVIPTAIERAGGTIVRFGMPVDPGNLLLLAEIGGNPILGAPGCARSPAENGFDWVLQRLLADISVTSEAISELGVGGLLMETGMRPHLREGTDKKQRKRAALVLAAGQSRRMGSENKMTVVVNGKPMVRHVVEAALTGSMHQVFVVTGHASEEVEAVLEGCPVEFVFNKGYAEGLSSSLRIGIQAVQAAGYDGALVLLGDMPFVSGDMVERMFEASVSNPNMIVLATAQGKRGNPVFWPARYFRELMRIKGDVGARHIVGEHEDFVMEIELGDAAGIDLDTPDAIRAHSGK